METQTAIMSGTAGSNEEVKMLKQKLARIREKLKLKRKQVMELRLEKQRRDEEELQELLGLRDDAADNSEAQ